MADSTLRGWELDELLAHHFSRPLYLCDPILPSGGRAMLHGQPGLGKTQLALTLAIAVAQGEDFLGFPCHQGPAAFFQLDTSEELFQDRLRRAFGWSEGNSSPTLPPIQVVTASYGEPVGDWLRRMPKAVEEVREMAPALVVVDSITQTHELDENTMEAAKYVYTAFQKLFPTSALLFIHHDRKADGAELVQDQAYSGHNAWMRPMDIGLHLVKTKEGPLLQFSKVRTEDRSKLPAIPLAMDKDTLLIEPAGVHAAAYAILRNSPNISQAEFVKRLVERNIPGGSRANAYKWWRRLMESNTKEGQA
jgi:RecA-family ATPase